MKIKCFHHILLAANTIDITTTTTSTSTTIIIVINNLWLSQWTCFDVDSLLMIYWLLCVGSSPYTSRYRFLELHYYRSEYSNKGKLIPSRMETVVIYLPDINSCMPTYSEWNILTQDYKAAVEKILNSKTPAVSSTGTSLKNSSPLANAEETPTVSSNDQNGVEKAQHFFNWKALSIDLSSYISICFRFYREVIYYLV